MKDYRFHNEYNLEVVYDEMEKLKVIYKLLEIIDVKIQKLEGNFDTYEGSCNLWIQNIVNYAKEAYNNAQIGNFVSFAIMQRCIIENYVCACFIKRFKKERLWEKWFISSMASTSDMVQKFTRDTQIQIKAQSEVNEFLDKISITKNWDMKASYGWTSEILKKKNPSFYDFCKFIDPSIYRDYRLLSDFSHGVNAINKTYRFTFVDTYLNLLSTLVMYVQKSTEELVGELLDESYWEQTDLFWNMMTEWIR